MLRMILGSLAIAALFSVGAARAADSTSKSDSQKKDRFQAIFSKADASADKLTVEITEKSGKASEKTLDLMKDVEIRDAAGKAAKLADLKAGDVLRITEKDGKVAKIHEENAATITKVDAKNGTVTVHMKDQSGKDVDRELKLTENAEYIDSNGNVAALDVFKTGDTVLFVEENGKIRGLSKTAAGNSSLTQRNDQNSGRK